MTAVATPPHSEPKRTLPAQVALLYGNLARSLGLAWALDRSLVARYLALGLLDALLPVAIAWVGKSIVDEVVANDYEVFTSRATVPMTRRLAVAGPAWWRARRARRRYGPGAGPGR